MNIGCKTDIDTGTSGSRGLGIGLGKVGPHGLWSLRQTDGKAGRNVSERDFASTNCITTSTTRHHGTKRHAGWSNMIWMDFFGFSHFLSKKGLPWMGQFGGPRFYHNFLGGDEWLWARGTKGVRLFYFWGAGGCIHGVHSGTVRWFFLYGHASVLGGLILFPEMYSAIV